MNHVNAHGTAKIIEFYQLYREVHPAARPAYEVLVQRRPQKLAKDLPLALVKAAIEAHIIEVVLHKNGTYRPFAPLWIIDRLWQIGTLLPPTLLLRVVEWRGLTDVDIAQNAWAQLVSEAVRLPVVDTIGIDLAQLLQATPKNLQQQFFETKLSIERIIELTGLSRYHLRSKASLPTNQKAGPTNLLDILEDRGGMPVQKETRAKVLKGPAAKRSKAASQSNG